MGIAGGELAGKLDSNNLLGLLQSLGMLPGDCARTPGCYWRAIRTTRTPDAVAGICEHRGCT